VVAAAVGGVIVAAVTLRLPPLDVRQLGALEIVLSGVREADVEGVREQLQSLILGPKPVWLPRHSSTVVAGLATLVVAANDGLWEFGEDVWDKYLPVARPSGRSEWRNANYALHAGACLAGGVWLDVARQEAFWHLPLWPFALDVVELLTVIASAEPGTSPSAVSDQLVDLISPTR
jgi:hypothetical protein